MAHEHNDNVNQAPGAVESSTSDGKLQIPLIQDFPPGHSPHYTDGKTNERTANISERIYFGNLLWGVSERHLAAKYDVPKLERFNLPHLRTELEVAQWLGISLPRLRWFTYDRMEDKTWHYFRYVRPKRDGSERVILAPKRELKALQRKVLEDILQHVPVAYSAHGFVRGRSTITNAHPHLGKQVVIGLDLKNFFPTIEYPRVRGMFIALGYSFPVASTLALLCTERDREPVTRQDGVYYVGRTERYLVQGAPTSPALANIIAWRLDLLLSDRASRLGFDYTRYADDITLSGNDPKAIRRMLSTAKRIIEEADFVVNDSKTHVIRQSGRQMVTGFVVNDQLSTPRRYRRQIRATLHNAKRTGLEQQNRSHHPDFRSQLRGRIAFVHSANPEHAARLEAALNALEP